MLVMILWHYVICMVMYRQSPFILLGVLLITTGTLGHFIMPQFTTEACLQSTWLVKSTGFILVGIVPEVD